MTKDDQSGLARHSKDAQDTDASKGATGADQTRKEQQSHSGREGTHKRDGEQIQQDQPSKS